MKTALYYRILGLSITAFMAASASAELPLKCVSLFQSSEKLTGMRIDPATGLLARTVVELSKKDILTEEIPDHWKARMSDGKTWGVVRSKYAIQRKSVKGQDYIAFYSSWTPKDRENPKGTIILQHGFTRSSRYFHDMILSLTTLGYKVVAPDGANIAGTLKLSEPLPTTDHGVLEDPSPVDDANVIRDIIYKEKIEKFVLLGHSRGHAVTGIVAGMAEFENRFIAHIPTNPYVEWLNDFVIDHSAPYQLILLQNAISEKFAGLLSPFMAKAVKTEAETMRETTNTIAVPAMKDLIKKSIEERGEHERIDGLSPDHEIQAAEMIGRGLRGKDDKKRGFSVFPLYGIALEDGKIPTFEEADNGFGLSQTAQRIGRIPDSVLRKTYVIWGKIDPIITPEIAEMLLKVKGVHSVPVENGTHHVPAEKPFVITDVIDRIFETETGIRRSAQ